MEVHVAGSVPSVGKRTDRDGEITHTNWEGAMQASL